MDNKDDRRVIINDRVEKAFEELTPEERKKLIGQSERTVKEAGKRLQEAFKPLIEDTALQEKFEQMQQAVLETSQALNRILPIYVKSVEESINRLAEHESLEGLPKRAKRLVYFLLSQPEFIEGSIEATPRDILIQGLDEKGSPTNSPYKEILERAIADEKKFQEIRIKAEKLQANSATTLTATEAAETVTALALAQLGYSYIATGYTARYLNQSYIGKAALKIDPFKGHYAGKFETDEYIISYESKFNTPLNAPALMVLLIFTDKLSRQASLKQIATGNLPIKYLTVELSIREYMELRGITSYARAKEQLEAAVNVLKNTTVFIKEQAEKKAGKRKKGKKETATGTGEIPIYGGTRQTEERVGRVKSGTIYFTFSSEYVKSLNQIQPLPSYKLLQIDTKKHPHALYIGLKLADTANCEKLHTKSPGKVRISVEKLLSAIPTLPTEAEVAENRKRDYNRYIVNPFEQNMKALKEEYHIIKSWKYTDVAAEKGFNSWKKWTIEAELGGYMEAEKLIESKKTPALSEKKQQKKLP